MFKKSLTLLICFSFLGCATPQKKAEDLANNINQESLKKTSSNTESSIKEEPHACFVRTTRDLIFIPFQVAAKGICDLGRVCIGFLSIPVIFVEAPIQIVRDLGNVSTEMGKAIVPPKKPTVK